MESISKILEEDILGLLTKCSPLFFTFVLFGLIPSFFRLLMGSLDEVGYSDSEETQEKTIPKKESETLAETKIVNKTRTVPRRCPYCYGILDNVDCCPYCGTVF